MVTVYIAVSLSIKLYELFISHCFNALLYTMFFNDKGIIWYNAKQYIYDHKMRLSQ